MGLASILPALAGVVLRSGGSSWALSEHPCQAPFFYPWSLLASALASSSLSLPPAPIPWHHPESPPGPLPRGTLADTQATSSRVIFLPEFKGDGGLQPCSARPFTGFKRGSRRHDVSHHHFTQGGPGESTPAGDRADRAAATTTPTSKLRGNSVRPIRARQCLPSAQWSRRG